MLGRSFRSSIPKNEGTPMHLLRFLGSLFVFFGILASCLAAVILALLMMRFWPVLIAVLLAGLLFEVMVTKAENQVSVTPR
jgi:hypothetical protein